MDANSGQPPLHTDIAALSHKECESQALSVWDVKDELSLVLLSSSLLSLLPSLLSRYLQYLMKLRFADLGSRVA